MAIMQGERPKGTCPFFEFFTPHYGLPYAQSPNSKAIWQLKTFPRQPT